MKILHINTVCGLGSTGSIAADIAAECEKRGHAYYIAYGQGDTAYHRSFKIGGRWENHFHNLVCSRLLGMQGYGTYRGTKKLIAWMRELAPDVVHLGNLHGNYLNLPLLFDYLRQSRIPVVLTLHDCWAFTGKCSHYTAAGCYKWKTQCEACPQYRKYPPTLFFDRSARLFRDKRNWFTSLARLQVVAVSQWLKQEAEESFLGKWPVSRIYNWVDSTRFRRVVPDETFCRKYRLPEGCKFLVSISAGWNEHSSKYRDAVNLASKLPSDYRLLLVGSVNRGTTIAPPICHIPYIADPGDLSAVYSLATAYVHLSVEDTFGKVIAEAMACGTPPIVFDSTACPEIAAEYGFAVAPHDVDTIVALLPRVESITPAHREKLIEHVRTNYDYAENTGRYLEIYEQMIS